MLYNIIPLKDSVFLKPRDYAKFLLKLYNNENKTISVTLYIYDPSWSLVYFPPKITLKPFEEKDIILYLFPQDFFKITDKIPVKIEYNNKSEIFTLNVNLKGIPYVDISLNYKQQINVGEKFNVSVCINSSYYQDFRLKLKLFDIEKEKWIFGKSFCNNFSILVPNYISGGEHKGVLTIEYDDIKREFPIVVNVFKNETPLIGKKDGKILIKNPHPYPIYYEYRLELNKNILPFLKFDPNPSYILISNKTYAVYKLFLYPNETKTIKVEFNYPLLFVISLPILAALFLIAYLYYLSPKVVINYQILKIDKEKKKIKLLITVSNYGRKEIKNVLVLLKLPSFLKVDKIEFVEGEIKENDITWKLDLKPGEERLILVTLSYEIEPTEPFKLELKVKHRKEEVKEILVKI